MYLITSDMDYCELANKYGIEDSQISMVKEKLKRYGLLSSKNDSIRDKSLNDVISYIHDVDKESRKRNPKSVKVPSSMKEIKNRDSYSLSTLGRAFLASIGEAE